jgi:glycerophosphoryl diester phosphodiesterase
MTTGRSSTDILVDGHLTRLKWHRARRTSTDTPFTLARITEGLREGASVEIDVRVSADGVPEIRHDPVRRWRRRQPAPALCTLADARITGTAPGAGEDTGGQFPPTALLQLDIKDNASVMTPANARRTAGAVGALASHVIVSGTDPRAAATVARQDPRFRLGHDPCTRRAVLRLRRTADIARFVGDALDAQPSADTVYLDHRLILAAAGRGHDIVADFHAAGKLVDAYTLTGPDETTLAQARALLELRVDQITTDDPDGFARSLA